jgi:hypothetical protein
MVRYKMVGVDFNASPKQYRTWVVNDTPDYNGYYYNGLKSGPEPLLDISAYEIQDGYAIVDFNLPQPLFWKAAYTTLPAATYNSQVAVIDDFVYLFGGQNSDVICRASLNNPAIWEDTGARLPTTLCGSQLAVIDGYMYLIGGLGGPSEEALDTIYRASTSDPLNWTNMGSRLPEVLHKSQLGIANGYIYLFGGQGVNYAKDNIFRASVSDPLTWIDTGTTLPAKLYGASSSLIDGYFYLYGGLLKEDTPVNTVYKALASNPSYFYIAGLLPFSACYGQFFTIADKGYLVTAGSVTGNQPYLTRILRCNISNPAVFVDTLRYIPGDVSQSQVAIIYDRIYLFGGNSSSVIYLSDQLQKYTITAGSTSQIYGNVTRTQYQSTVNQLDLTEVIGLSYWKTNYKW